MLMIDFSLGKQDYALPCSHVVEVIPRVALTKIEKSLTYVAGMCNLRGSPIPVVDVTLWVTGKESCDRLDTRIIIVELDLEKKDRQVGLIVENVTRTTQREIETFIDTGVRSKELPFLGGVASENNKTRQLLLIKPLKELLEPVIFTESSS